MKARSKYLFLIISTSCFAVVIGCSKKTPVAPSGGGTGGSCVISVIPEHHGSYVDTCTVYIKYNTLDAPSDGVYDDSVVCVLRDSVPVAVFPGLRKGDYYLFARGYHALYVPPYVKGGVPCTISALDSTKVYLPTYSY